jgi:hypothetical protein
MVIAVDADALEDPVIVEDHVRVVVVTTTGRARPQRSELRLKDRDAAAQRCLPVRI